jgi:hypothetical protein
MLTSSRNIVRVLCSWALVLAAFSIASPSRADIKTPGDHPDYSVELEPHFVLQWDNTYYADDGIGFGGRVNFPVIKNGPIRTINNNFAIGVGLDFVFFGNDCGYYVRGRNIVVGPGWDCSGNQIHIPVVAQWNFFFTPVISLFGEAGFAIRHASYDVGCGNGVNGPYCGGFSDTDLEGVFAVGPRFTVGDTVSIVLRVGYPYFSAGVSFLL